MAVSASIEVDFIGLLLAERLRRERGAELSAGAASLGDRFGPIELGPWIRWS